MCVRQSGDRAKDLSSCKIAESRFQRAKKPVAGNMGTGTGQRPGMCSTSRQSRSAQLAPFTDSGELSRSDPSSFRWADAAPLHFSTPPYASSQTDFEKLRLLHIPAAQTRLLGARSMATAHRV